MDQNAINAEDLDIWLETAMILNREDLNVIAAIKEVIWLKIAHKAIEKLQWNVINAIKQGILLNNAKVAKIVI